MMNQERERESETVLKKESERERLLKRERERERLVAFHLLA